MEYYFLESYGDRNKYVSVKNNFFSDKEKNKTVHTYHNRYIYEKNVLYEKSDFKVLLTDLYSDKEDKENWNSMFAAAQLAEHPDEQKMYGDLLGCTRELIVIDEIKDIFLNFCDKKSTEFIPIGLRDDKVKLPNNYFLINPLLEIDALNYQASEFTFFFDEFQSDTAKKIFLDSTKLKKAPDIFRIRYKRHQIVISQTVVDELKKYNPSNIRIKKIPQLPKEDTIDDEKYKLNTALFSASQHDKFKLVKSMIERGGDINYKNPNGISTLEILKKKAQIELISLFNSLNT